jgi:hypothetical protein
MKALLIVESGVAQNDGALLKRFNDLWTITSTGCNLGLRRAKAIDMKVAPIDSSALCAYFHVFPMLQTPEILFGKYAQTTLGVSSHPQLVRRYSSK